MSYTAISKNLPESSIFGSKTCPKVRVCLLFFIILNRPLQIPSESPSPDIANQGAPSVGSLFKEHLNSVYGDDDFSGSDYEYDNRFAFKMPPWNSADDDDDASSAGNEASFWNKGGNSIEKKLA